MRGTESGFEPEPADTRHVFNDHQKSPTKETTIEMINAPPTTLILALGVAMATTTGGGILQIDAVSTGLGGTGGSNDVKFDVHTSGAAISSTIAT